MFSNLCIQRNEIIFRMGQEINVAVINFKGGSGVSVQDAELITDRINVELFNTKRVNLLER